VYGQIVVPLDGSRFAESALPLALELSRRTDASLHLVTVHEPVPAFAYDEWESAASEWSRRYLDEVMDEVEDRAGGPVTTALRTGPVVPSLQDEVRSVGGDLLVMATHGRGMLSRAWLGSVADAFLHKSDVPVLMVRPEDTTDEEEEEEEAEGILRVLVPLDGTELSEEVLQHALKLGGLFGAAYHLLRVVPYPMDLASPYLPHTVQMNRGLVEEAERDAEAYLDRQAEELRGKGLTITTGTLVDAQPAHGILQVAQGEECDLIAMATHGRRGLSRAFLGSTADKVIRGSHMPVLVYRGLED